MNITPGGNPTCDMCGCWYGIGAKHETGEDCIQNLTRIYQLNGPDEFPEDYYRYLAMQYIAKWRDEQDNV